MALYLVQHGKSLPKTEDPEKGLSEEGLSEVKRIAEVAQGYRIPVAHILHSGKKRARQTAEVFARTLNPSEGIAATEGIKPLDDVAPIAEKLDSAANVMLVGHLPFMQRLASWLILGAIEPAVFAFQNGGIVCLDRHRQTGKWIIRWALMPHID